MRPVTTIRLPPAATAMESRYFIIDLKSRVLHKRRLPVLSGWCRKIATPLAAWFPLILFSACSLLPDLCEGASTIPGEGQHGFFYAITHLHPVVYLILLFIAVLSVINLVVQGWLPPRVWQFSRIDTFSPKMGRKGAHGSPGQGFEQARPGSSGKPTLGKASRNPPGQRGRDEGIIGVRRVAKGSDPGTAANIPTPMEGINHSLPQFAATRAAQTGTPRILEREPDQKPPAQEFKFSSAVDLLSHEEMERREKKQLVVSGTVKGPDGQGIASVMVYLTDQAGNRVGQSSRSARDTGEFKVLVNERGRYALTGYKRGFIMEGSEPLILPIESGKIEGFNFRMMPEGCLVHGRVLVEGEKGDAPDLEVTCVCADGAFSRSDRTDPAGEFRISGVPLASKCFIEVYGIDGEVLARSAPFETLHKKEVYRKIAIPSLPSSKKTSSVGIEPVVVWDDDKGDHTGPPHPPAAGSITQT